MKSKSHSTFNMQSVTACISTMLVLMLLGLVVFFVLAANNLSVYVRENIAVSVQLSDDMPETEILQFQKQLNAKHYVKKTTYFSKAQALREQTEAMGTDPAEFIGHNPFNASIEIKLHSAYVHSDSLQWIQEYLLENKHVLEVDYPQDLMDAVNRNLQKISLVLLGLAALLTLVSFALINNTIRLAIYSQRFLIHTMKLVGASRSFIRRPYIIRHIRTGLFAAILADSALLAMGYLLIQYEPALTAVITPEVALIVAGSVLVFGIIITGLCALVSINKFLRLKADELYYI